MFYVYVLQSLADRGLYIGYTANLRLRLAQHQLGESQATKSRRPWRLIYYEAYFHQDDALGRERFLKSGTGRSFLRKQCSGYFRVYGCADAAGRVYGCADAAGRVHGGADAAGGVDGGADAAGRGEADPGASREEADDGRRIKRCPNSAPGPDATSPRARRRRKPRDIGRSE